MPRANVPARCGSTSTSAVATIRPGQSARRADQLRDAVVGHVRDEDRRRAGAGRSIDARHAPDPGLERREHRLAVGEHVGVVPLGRGQDRHGGPVRVEVAGVLVRLHDERGAVAPARGRRDADPGQRRRQQGAHEGARVQRRPPPARRRASPTSCSCRASPPPRPASAARPRPRRPAATPRAGCPPRARRRSSGLSGSMAVSALVTASRAGGPPAASRTCAGVVAVRDVDPGDRERRRVLARRRPGRSRRPPRRPTRRAAPPPRLPRRPRRRRGSARRARSGARVVRVRAPPRPRPRRGSASRGRIPGSCRATARALPRRARAAARSRRRRCRACWRSGRRATGSAAPRALRCPRPRRTRGPRASRRSRRPGRRRPSRRRRGRRAGARARPRPWRPRPARRPPRAPRGPPRGTPSERRLDVVRIGDDPAAHVRRRAGHLGEGMGDEPAGARLGGGDREPQRDAPCLEPFGELDQRVAHHGHLSCVRCGSACPTARTSRSRGCPCSTSGRGPCR